MSSVAILLWSPAISGGTNVIFEHALAMQRTGHDITVIMESPLDECDIEWFPKVSSFNWKTYEEAEGVQFDLVIATWWRTAFSLHRILAKRHVFFVQSIESYFYPKEEVPLRDLVDATYLFPVNYVTEATWIKEHLYKEYGHEALLVKNGINKSYFTDAGIVRENKIPGKMRVLVEGPLGVDFKNVERTIELCKQSDCDEVWLLTLSDIDSYPGVDKVFSKVPIDQVGEIYRSCDVLVKLSKVEGMFGPPLEMYHCGGTSVTYDVTGHDEYIKDGVNGIVIPMDNEAEVVDAINELKADAEKLFHLKKQAKLTADSWPDWKQSGDEFITAIETILKDGTEVSRNLLDGQSRRAWKQYEYSEKLRLQMNDEEGGNTELLNAIASQTTMIEERDKYIKELEGRFDESVAAIRSQDNLIEERDRYIKELEGKLG